MLSHSVMLLLIRLRDFPLVPLCYLVCKYNDTSGLAYDVGKGRGFVLEEKIFDRKSVEDEGFQYPLDM